MKTSFVGTLSEPIPRQRRTTLKTTASMRTHKRQESRDAQRDGPSPNARVTRGERTGTRRIPLSCVFGSAASLRGARRRRRSQKETRSPIFSFFFLFLRIPALLSSFPKTLFDLPFWKESKKKNKYDDTKKGVPARRRPQRREGSELRGDRPAKPLPPPGRKMLRPSGVPKTTPQTHRR